MKPSIDSERGNEDVGRPGRSEPQTDQHKNCSGLLRLSVDEDAKSEVNAVAESSADDEAGSTRSGNARIGTWARLGRSVPVRDERLQDHAL